MYRFILIAVLVAVLASVFAPVAFAGCPGGNCGGGQGGGQGWFQKAKAAFSPNNTQQQRFFSSNNAVRTGVPGVRANDLTTSEGRAAFQAPNLGASQWYKDLSSSAINAAQSAYNNSHQ